VSRVKASIADAVVGWQRYEDFMATLLFLTSDNNTQASKSLDEYLESLPVLRNSCAVALSETDTRSFPLPETKLPGHKNDHSPHLVPRLRSGAIPPRTIRLHDMHRSTVTFTYIYCVFVRKLKHMRRIDKRRLTVFR
jgi:hypothetical protein